MRSKTSLCFLSSYVKLLTKLRFSFFYGCYIGKCNMQWKNLKIKSFVFRFVLWPTYINFAFCKPKNEVMINQQYPSKLLEKAVSEFAKLPGVGRKTALRLVLHLLRQDAGETDSFANALIELRHNVKHCRVCHNVSDSDICPICANPRRDTSLVCVVENIQDVMAVENTQQYNGLYHVLGGVISPMDGIGPGDIEIDSLEKRVSADDGIQEIILALSPTMEGDTTNFFISRRLQPFGRKVSVIARGISVGNELEYTDEVTLGRSILNRTPFE